MKRHPLLAFFALMFIFSWGIWVPVARGWSWALPVAPNRAQLFGAFGPCLAAVIVIAVVGGRDGLRRFLERLLIWRVGIRWYLAALFLPAVISLLTTALHTMFGGDAPNFADPPIYHVALPSFYAQFNVWTILVPFYLQTLLAGSAVGEELGWRGFALPHLQGRLSALGASVALALVWSVWTLPLLGRQSLMGYVLSLASVLLMVIPGTIFSTWIYNNTRGSLLLVVLFNHAPKITDAFLASSAAPPILTVAALWLVALAIIAWAGPQNLSRRPLDEHCRS